MNNIKNIEKQRRIRKERKEGRMLGERKGHREQNILNAIGQKYSSTDWSAIIE